MSDLAESYDPLGAHGADPYPFYARARREEPVFHSPRIDAWVITRFADIDAILKDPATFSSVNSLRPIRPLYESTFAVLAGGYPMTPDAVTSDGDGHRRIRQPYAKHLTTPGRLKDLEPGIHRRAEALVDGFLGDGEADLVARFSSPLPAAVAGGLFGFDAADVAAAKLGSESSFQLGTVDLTEAEETAVARNVVAFKQLLIDYVRRRRAEPTGDLISDVVAALAPGDEPLTYDQEAELVTSLGSTFGASHITTADLIGSALRLLLAHPAQWQLLCQSPSLISQAVEEVLRFEAPIPTMFRRATRTASVAGVEIPAGADVLLVFASANHDEDRHPDPARFDITRKPTRHLSFGAGIHTCVGAAPARSQARIALHLLTERLPSLSLAPGHPIPIRKSVNIRGPLKLPARW